MPDAPRARLSAIIASCDSPATLRPCLAALVDQAEVAEIVVSDGSAIDPSGALRGEFPAVRFLHSPDAGSIPALRWAALPHASGAIVGFLEASCVPAADWARTLLEAHDAYPSSPAIGGPIALGAARRAFDFALYWCEYSAVAPPAASGASAQLSGANVSYKRAALEPHRDLIAAGAWETPFHERWRAEGAEPRLCQAAVVFHNAVAPDTAMRQRWRYGRGYAAERSARWSSARRIVYALLAPLLPLLLTARMAGRALAKKRVASFLRALGWILLLSSFWSAGEAAGYLLGEGERPSFR